MSRLAITLIDVGWGDSVLIESEEAGSTFYGLVDSNDTMHSRSSYLFLKRFFERIGKPTVRPNQTFEFVLLSHAHADHAEGLPRIIREFGAKRFLYPISNPHPILAQILRYGRRAHSRLAHTQAIHNNTNLNSIAFGAVTFDILWPHPGIIARDENDNSIVMALTLGDVSFVLTGDATAAGVWSSITSRLPTNTRVFQVPHHGARNGTFDDSRKATPWLTHFQGQQLQVAMSSHIRPHRHPDPEVVRALDLAAPQIKQFRTDLHYHIRFETDGDDVSVHYSHV